MQNLQTISVIIPVYNVEKYIEECLNSVTNQTYTNLEIICIDDCGTDNSIKIVEEFAKKDNRIKIIYNEKNKGLVFTRKTGLNNSTGEYIGFVDSDDFVDLNYFETMFNKIIETNLEIVQNNNIYFYFNENKKQKKSYKHKTNNTIYEINSENIKYITNSVWNKLYKKDFLIKNNISCPENIIMGEDKCFTYNCIIHTKNIALFDGGNYYYRQNNNSITNKYKQNNDIINCIKYITNLIIKNNKQNIIPIPFNDLKNNLGKSSNKNKLLLEIKEFFIGINQIVEDNKNLYDKKNLLFFNCILNSNNYCLFKIKYILKKHFGI